MTTTQLRREQDASRVPKLLTLQRTQPLTYLSGGSQTDVYLSVDRRFVLKLKRVAGRADAAQARAVQLNQFAHTLYTHLGPDHSLRIWFVVTNDDAGSPLIVGIQPFLAGAQPLDAINISALPATDRAALLARLHTIITRSLACYRATGRVADLYGYGRKAGAEARRWDPRRLLSEGWRLISQRPLLTAHNLMLTPDGRVVLVDYDLICHSRALCHLIYAARVLLLLRDLAQLRGEGAHTPPAPHL
jgi:hypothetical protein